MPPKRKAVSAPSTAPSAKQAKVTVDGGSKQQYTVPVDEGFHDGGAAPKVHVDADGAVYDAALNQTNIKENNNKFYRIQVIEATSVGQPRYWCLTRWGRVGAFGQMKLFGPDDLEAMGNEFEAKFKAKTGLSWENRETAPNEGKYTYLEREYEQVGTFVSEDKEEEVGASEQESRLPKQVQSLIKLIFNQTSFEVTLQSIGYDSSKLPLGKLSKSTLHLGLRYLKELEDNMKNPELAAEEYEGGLQEAIEEHSNKYYSTIPHTSPGRQRLPLIDNLTMIKAETDMLDTLMLMEASSDIIEEAKKRQHKAQAIKMALLDSHLERLKLDEVTPLEPAAKEYQTLSKYLVNTSGYSHGISYKVGEIFRIRRQGEWDRFEKACAKISNSCRRLLWHGSRTTNFGGILSQGLGIAPPEAPVSGYMFGKGIYLVDISTKSANYCWASPGEPGLLLVCEAELGAPILRLVAADCEAGDKAKEKGYIATTGLGMTVPSSWTDAQVVHKGLKGVLMPDPDKKPQTQDHRSNLHLMYNEYIVYDEAQVRIRYIIRFEHDRRC